MNPTYSVIGSRIREQRGYLVHSRDAFAAKIGLPLTFCSTIELGLKGMSLPTLCKISKVLHLSTDFVLFGEKPGETADQISLMLSQCSSKRRAYAEQILKIFLISDEE